MAVITRYIVERNGEEKMTFVSKKEADAFDKELDIAENLQAVLSESELDIDEKLLEEISLYIARRRDVVGLLLKGSKPKKESTVTDDSVTTESKSQPKKKLKAVDSAVA